MAVKTIAGQAHVNRLVKLYTTTEQEIAQKITAALAKNNGEKKASITALEKQLAEIKASLRALKSETENPVEKLINTAFGGGVGIARQELKEAGINLIATAGTVNAKAMNVYASQTYSRLMEVITVAGRTATDVYKALEMDTAMSGLLGGYDSLDSVRRKIQRAAEGKGLTAFVDSRGRQWSMGHYVDMLLRTSSMHVYNEARKSEYLRHGEDLVIVSSHTPTCEMCADWNGAVLSLTGTTEGYPTLEDAESHGLFHPNCRHTYSLYIPEGKKSSAEEAKEQQDEEQSVDNREDDLRKLFSVGVPASDLDNIVEAFKDADPEISAFIDKYGPVLRCQATTGGGFFRRDSLTVFIDKKDPDVINTIRHEVGHFIDRMKRDAGLPYYSSGSDFTAAIDADKKLFSGNSKVAIAFKQSMKDAMKSGEKYYNNSAVSDIFCSMTKGNIRGVGYHSKAYYKGPEGDVRVKAEVFAELFELKTKKDYAAIEYVRSFFPTVVKAFEDMMKGGP